MTTLASRVRLPEQNALTSLRRHAALTRELAWTQFKLRYTGSVLGYLWSLLKPAMLFSIMFAIFVVIFKQTQQQFGVQLLVGVVLFTFFVECTSTAMSSIVGNAGLIQKAYFPRAILVVASSLTASMTFAINLTLITVVTAALGDMHLSVRSLIVIPLVAELYVLALGLSLLLASLFVFYRDLGHIWEILTQVIFYASAVVFPVSRVPERFHVAFFLNPMAQIIEDMRHALVLPDIPSTASLVGLNAAIPVAIALLALVIGVATFRLLSPSFAENL